MEDNQDQSTEELNPSALGSKKYWDKSYNVELENFNAHGDVGEIWFGEDIMLKMISCVNKYAEGKESRIVDLGCGNGMTLLELARLDYTNLVGMDYSQNAISLCENLFSKQDCKPVEFKVADLLSEEFVEQSFDICLDKGTYDAVSLIPDANQFESRQKYLKNVHRLLTPDGIFILASCNWTTSELTTQTQALFSLNEVVKTPQFSFGGKTGNVVSLIVLKRKA